MKLETLEAKMARAAFMQRGMSITIGMAFVGIIGGVISRALSHPSPSAIAFGALSAIGLASYAWQQVRLAREQSSLYAGRWAGLPDEPYYAVPFDNATEMAAFVAALGRQLHSPREDLASYDEDIDISVKTGSGGCILYLSDAAMRAFTTAFAAPPEARPIKGRDLPKDRHPLLVGRPALPPGQDDIAKLIPSKKPT